MHRKKVTRLLGATLVMLLVAAVLLGCQAQPAAPATQAPAAPPTKAAASAPTQVQATAPTQAPAAPTQAPAAAETFKLGLSIVLTGPYAPVGIASNRIVQMGVDDVNAKGGFKVGGKTFRFSLVTADDKGTAEGARDAANRLILNEKVRVQLAGGLMSVAGAQVLSEQSKVLLLSPTVADTQLGPKYPLTLAAGEPPQLLHEAAAEDWLIKAHPQAKRLVAVLPDDAVGRAHKGNIEQAIKDRGLTLVGTEFFGPEAKDLSPLALRLLQQKPDAIALGTTPGWAPSFISVAKALNEQGFRGPLIATYADKQVLQAGGAAEGLVFTELSDYKSPQVSASERDVFDRYVQKYGEQEFFTPARVMYLLPSLVAQALEKAGTVDDMEKVANALRQGQWDTYYGKASFTGTKTYGQPSVLGAPLYVSQVQGDKIVTIGRTMLDMP